MKALTISQPFASLIANGEKWIENRTWPTSYRGPLAIHAGKGTQYLDRQQLREYPTSCVIAVATLVACVKYDRILELGQKWHMGSHMRVVGTQRTWGDLLSHRHAEGPWCWILDDVRQVEPVEIRGAQGLWELTVDLTVRSKS